jgi:hypothetical protein
MALGTAPVEFLKGRLTGAVDRQVGEASRYRGDVVACRPVTLFATDRAVCRFWP